MPAKSHNTGARTHAFVFLLTTALTMTSACSPAKHEAPRASDAEIPTDSQPALRVDRDTAATVASEALNAQSVDEALGEPTDLLPDLFDKDPTGRRARVEGTLLTNEDGTTLEDRLDGVEITVEVPTR